MLRQIRLYNFKAFEQYTVNFSRNSLVVGPNNAGKSTLLSAVRTCAKLLQHAGRFAPDIQKTDNGRDVLAYGFSGENVGLVEENLAHEFRDVETRMVATFWDWSKLTAVWPKPSGDHPPDSFFYIEVHDRAQPRRPKEVRKYLPNLGVVPLLAPIEREENVLVEGYVRQNLDTRRASLHLRNQFWLLKEGKLGPGCDYDEFVSFLEQWLPEIDFTLLRASPTAKGSRLDLFYLEEGSTREKEIFWVGDGVQVWTQLLLHLYRLRSADSIVLDEPDVYLHADLQRRLVRLLEKLTAQTVTATHSAEMVAEASADSLIWVDKSRPRGIRARDEVTAGLVAQSLGSHFNLRLARALRSQTVLFVEGQDMRILQAFAEVIGANLLANERRVAIVPLGGGANWHHVEPFKWVVDDFLDGSIHTFVLLDRDYRPPEWADELSDKLAGLGIRCHIWRRKELESYLLESALIARTVGIDIAMAEALLAEAIESLKTKVHSRMTSDYLEFHSGSRRASTTLIHEATESFDALWASPDGRARIVPAKEALTRLNGLLGDAGLATPSIRALAANLQVSDVSDEVRDLLIEIEGTLV